MARPEDRMRRTEEVFAAATDLNGAEREEFLASLGAAEPEMVAEVRSLLHSLESNLGFLAEPVCIEWTDLESERQHPIDGAATLELGQIGRYRLIDTIGEGGMGLVFRARQDNPSRQVALKVSRWPVEDVAEMRREGDLLGRLQHPAIAQVIEAGTCELGGRTHAFLAIELLQNAMTILAYAESRGLGMRDRIALFADACAGVAHAHQKQVLHRDVKPSNLLVTDGGQVKIIDFGVAVDVTAERTSRDFAGTRSYMSPQRLASDGDDARDDVYSLGVVLSELVSRCCETAEPRLDPDLAAVVARARADSREDRYGSVDTLLQDLDRWLRHEPVESRPSNLGRGIYLLIRRHRAAAAALLVSALAGATGLGFFYSDNLRAVREVRKEIDASNRKAHELEETRRRLAALRQSLVPDAVAPGRPGGRWRRSSARSELVASVEDSVLAIATEEERRIELGFAIDRLRPLEELADSDHGLLLAIAHTYLEFSALLGNEERVGPAHAAVTVRATSRAVTILTELSTVRPLDRAIGLALADALVRHTSALRIQGRIDSASRFADRSVAHAEDLFGDDDRQLEAALLCVSARHARADLEFGAAATPRNLAADCHRAVAICRRLTSAAPGNARVLHWLAGSLHRLGRTPGEADDTALKTLAEATEMRMQVCRLRPDVRAGIRALLEMTCEEITLCARIHGPARAARRQSKIQSAASLAIRTGHHGSAVAVAYAVGESRHAELLVDAGERSRAAEHLARLGRVLDGWRTDSEVPITPTRVLDELLAGCLNRHAELVWRTDLGTAFDDTTRALELSPENPFLLANHARMQVALGMEAAAKITRAHALQKLDEMHQHHAAAESLRTELRALLRDHDGSRENRGKKDGFQ